MEEGEDTTYENANSDWERDKKYNNLAKSNSAAKIQFPFLQESARSTKQIEQKQNPKHKETPTIFNVENPSMQG